MDGFGEGKNLLRQGHALFYDWVHRHNRLDMKEELGDLLFWDRTGCSLQEFPYASDHILSGQRNLGIEEQSGVLVQRHHEPSRVIGRELLGYGVVPDGLGYQPLSGPPTLASKSPEDIEFVFLERSVRA